MAKKEFTDITIKLCQKDCNFKRVTNQTLTAFADKVEKEYNETVKDFINEVEHLDDKRISLQKKIDLKNKQVSLIERKQDANDDELDRMFDILEDVEHLEDELDIVKTRLVDLGNDSPLDEHNKKTDELLAEKVETLLEGITAQEFTELSDPVDTIKARNLEKYYQLCIVGEREARIRQEMKEDVDNFLKSQQRIRESS